MQPDQPEYADETERMQAEADAQAEAAYERGLAEGKLEGRKIGYGRGFEQGVAEGRRQATEGNPWAGLDVQHEDEQWSVWWRATPGSGLNVTVPTDNEADHEAAVREFQAEHGGEIKRRTRVSLVGPWEPAEQPEPVVVERVSAETIASVLAVVDAPYRPGLDVEFADEEAAADRTAAAIANEIRAELVCCGIYDEDEGTVRAGTRHAICFWGEAAARIAERYGLEPDGSDGEPASGGVVEPSRADRRGGEVTTLDRWQRPDGFPADAYFEAVESALLAAGVGVEWSSREEDWEFNVALTEDAYRSGPLSWAKHGLIVSWRCDEQDEPTHADDFTGLGWYWVPYSKPQVAQGDYAKEFDLPYLTEPEQVAEAVRALVREGA